MTNKVSTTCFGKKGILQVIKASCGDTERVIKVGVVGEWNCVLNLITLALIPYQLCHTTV